LFAMAREVRRAMEGGLQHAATPTKATGAPRA